MEDSYFDACHSRMEGGLVRNSIYPCHMNPTPACGILDKYLGMVLYQRNTLRAGESENENDEVGEDKTKTRRTSFIEKRTEKRKRSEHYEGRSEPARERSSIVKHRPLGITKRRGSWLPQRAQRCFRHAQQCFAMNPIIT
jgi:hypothetical protein